MYGFFMSCSPFCVVCRSYPPIVHVLACVLFILLQERREIFSHSPLEEGRGIAHSKVHDLRNIRPMACLDRCFVSVFFSKADVIISVTNVKLGEQCFAL